MSEEIIVLKKSNEPIRSVKSSGRDIEGIVRDYTKHSLSDVFILDSSDLDIDYSDELISNDFRIYKDGSVKDNRETKYRYLLEKKKSIGDKEVNQKTSKIFNEYLDKNEEKELENFLGMDIVRIEEVNK